MQDFNEQHIAKSLWAKGNPGSNLQEVFDSLYLAGAAKAQDFNT